MKKYQPHPACAMVPKMSAEDFGALKDDIAENGLIEPIWIKDGLIIDGRHRYRACRELGIAVQVREYAGDNIESFVISTALRRRHLRQNQKAAFIKRLVKLNPELSARQIAEVAGVSHHTVGAYKEELQAGGQIAHLSQVVGADGKSYEIPAKKPVKSPRGRPRSTPAPTHKVASLVRSEDFEAKRHIKWLHDLHAGDLTDPDDFIGKVETEIFRLRAEMQSRNVG